MSASDKLLRWLDVIASLLGRRYPVALSDLRRDVPGYDDPTVQENSILRMFERDKDELRELGVVIDTLPPDSEGVVKYQLRKHDFYLPFLSVCETMLPAQTDVRQQPRTAGPGSSRGVATVVLTPDACHTLRRAAARVAGLGHEELANDATAALRKLQFDIEDFAQSLPAAAVLQVDGTAFDTLTDAVALRKRIHFTYHSMARDEQAVRTVDPYGLIFLTGHWYLVAHDVEREALRQFRVSRIRDAAMSNNRKQHPDFDIPAGFNLSAYAASRQAWEIGNGGECHVLVVFTGASGNVMQGQQLGDPVAPDHPAHGAHDGAHDGVLRAFRVRRRDVFLRWVLSFAGDARPVSPPEVVEEWYALLRDTRAAHASIAPVAALVDEPGGVQ
jgi:proteasome accessory factor B